MHRPVSILLVLALASSWLSAQQISGNIDPAVAGPGIWLTLHSTRGAVHFPIDSAQIDRRGTFRFRSTPRPLGYYRLGIGEDQIDLILNPAEPHVNFHFDGSPLREHVQVRASLENQRLWEYKYASRDAQDQMRRIAGQRALLNPRDTDGLMRLAAEEEAVDSRLQGVLQRLLEQDEGSYFRKVALTDRRLVTALPAGTVAIRNAMDWRDASLVRSSVYPRAIMGILQSASPAIPHVLMNASDSILAWSLPDTTCWAFARLQLLELFSTYGPEEVVQHLVDRYVTGPGARVAADSRLLAMVALQLRSAVGSLAPDMELPSPITGHRDRLLQLVQPHRFTVLFFYSSTCDHCHEQMGPLNDLYRRYQGKGLQILGVAIDADEAEFRRNIVERQLAFPCYSELQAWGSPSAKAFAVKATPWFILLNREGRIVAKPHDAAELEELLPVLLP